MDPTPTPTPSPAPAPSPASVRCSSKHHLFLMESSSSSSSCSWNSSQQKRQRSTSDEYEDHVPVSTVIGSEGSSDYKNKKPVGYGAELQKQIQDASSDDFIVPSIDQNALETHALDDAKKSIEPSEAVYIVSNHSDECEDYYDEDDDYVDDDDYVYDDDMIDNDCSYGLAAKFDDLDLPPGVEATVPWLQKPARERPQSDKHIALEDEIDVRFKSFKQFDTVSDFSDHHYGKGNKEVKKPSKEWTKKIQQDWKVLENDLPETIFVRVYEERMDLLRAVIVGPAGTPYHDGLFFFDFYFPTNYPQVPPQAHYHSGGLRLNPNLYACGKVCLSLLGTWSGQGCERWDPNKSTMLQVLVSIQALVLNEKPYFNEPGFEMSANTNHGERSAYAYNETAFIYSCKTMLYSLRKPPKHFEDYVAGHFRIHGHTILVACRAYLGTAHIGCAIEEEKGQADAGGSSSQKVCSQDFKAQLKQLFEDLLMEFTVKGANCKEFLQQKVKVGDATAIPKAAEDGTKP